MSGGHFPAELKFTGYDGLIIRGKAREPVYLWIQAGKCEVRAATKLWGKDTYESSDILKRETGLSMLTVESDYDATETGPLQTRIETFIETIRR